MKRLGLIISVMGLSLFCIIPAWGQTAPTLAISDFEIQTDNTKHTYLGKGFAEIVGFELGKTKTIRLVDREKRNAVLEEMEFSLSGIADETNQIQVGKLLSVRYLVYGSIIDMGEELLFNLKMLDVETSQIVWNDQLVERPSKYAYIGGYFARSLLSYFKAPVSETLQVAAKPTKTEAADAVVALSEGIAALDAGKKEEARAKLETAKKLDPGSGVINALLAKVASLSAKFKVAPERYMSYWNPAYLGGITSDSLMIYGAGGWHTWGRYDSNNKQTIATDSDELWGVGEARGGTSMAYYVPLASGIGLGADVVYVNWKDSVVKKTNGTSPVYAQEGNQHSDYVGGILSLGMALSPNFSIGTGLQAAVLQRKYYIFNQTNEQYIEDPQTVFGGTLATVLKTRSGNISWDTLVSWTTEQQYWYNTSSNSLEPYKAPVYFEQTLTGVLGGGKTSLALKQVNDLYLDRDVYYVRLMPMAETWLANFLGLRLGIEGSTVIRSGTILPGWGGTGGLSLKFGQFTIDANYTLRQRPSRSLPDIVVPESILYLAITMNGLFKK